MNLETENLYFPFMLIKHDTLHVHCTTRSVNCTVDRTATKKKRDYRMIILEPIGQNVNSAFKRPYGELYSISVTFHF